LRERLNEALRGQFEDAQAKSAERIAQAVAPYSRFVRSEHERWSAAHATLTALRDRASALLAEVPQSSQ
jgi:hypothetical protein